MSAIFSLLYFYVTIFFVRYFQGFKNAGFFGGAVASGGLGGSGTAALLCLTNIPMTICLSNRKKILNIEDIPFPMIHQDMDLFTRYPNP